jgi:hypothetical protein
MKRRLSKASNSSSISASLRFWSGRQSCKLSLVRKIQSARWTREFYYNRAAMRSQRIRLDFTLSTSKITNHSDLDVGFHVTLSMVRNPLQANYAKTHWKKIWSTFSTSPQSAQVPLEGPRRLRIWSFQGSFPLTNCQAKFLIFKGTVVFQMGFARAWVAHDWAACT